MLTAIQSGLHERVAFFTVVYLDSYTIEFTQETIAHVAIVHVISVDQHDVGTYLGC